MLNSDERFWTKLLRFLQAVLLTTFSTV